MIIKSYERVELLGGRVKTTAQEMFASLKKEKPAFLFNAGMYDTKSGLTVCDTIVDGKLINGGNYTNKGFILGDEVRPATTEDAVRERAKYFLGGSPSLVWDGEVDIDAKGFDSYFIKKALSFRIGMGVDADGRIIFEFPLEEKMTVEQFARHMHGKGCVYAINLDGGGSCRAMKEKAGGLVAMNIPTENRAVSTWLAVYGSKEHIKVCIDAGHAKNTTGKRSFDGSFFEYEFNRDVAKMLRYHLERHGVECFYSCDLEDEQDVVISKRAKTANDGGADYLISIHANAYGADWNSATGWECYICARGGKAEKLAKSIEKESAVLGLKNRGVKVKEFAILVDTEMPAVLVEHGFYTNKEELAKLKDTDFREQCAIADCKGILSLIGIDWVEESAPVSDSWQWGIGEGLVDESEQQSDTITKEELVKILYRLQQKRG